MKECTVCIQEKGLEKSIGGRKPYYTVQFNHTPPHTFLTHVSREGRLRNTIGMHLQFTCKFFKIFKYADVFDCQDHLIAYKNDTDYRQPIVKLFINICISLNYSTLCLRKLILFMATLRYGVCDFLRRPHCLSFFLILYSIVQRRPN